jgi:mono/diheme cytochrome c family protein
MFSTRRKISAKAAFSVAAVSTAAIVAASAASGQDAALAPQGDFALTVSLVETDAGSPVAIGDGRMAMAVNQVARLFSEGDPGGFLDNATGYCTSYQIVDFAANTVEITGYCSYQDDDGDYAFEQIATDGAVANGAVTLTGNWIGGTGKYESLEGAVTTELGAAVQEGDAILVGGRKSGSYAIASAVAQEPPANPAPPAAEPPANPAPPAAEDDAALMAALMAEGEDGFNRNCATCHGRDGMGIVGPRLAGNSFLSSSGAIVGQILVGNTDHGMPHFADRLTDRQIAAIATYVRNSWGNEYGIVRENAVAIRR